jgi:hypothetical protein
MVVVGYDVVTIQADGLCFMVEKGRRTRLQSEHGSRVNP